jgi:two-component system phosphate regulon sensor histidine kinase PhoR
MDQEKNKLTVRATHELKAPFAAITSYLYTLRDGYCGELPPKAHSTILKMINRCDQLTGKITDIIHLSNLKTSIFNKHDFTKINIIPIIEGVVRQAVTIGETRSIKIKFIRSDKTIFIDGIEDHLKTLLSNLLSNAINYSEENSTVEVRAEKVQKNLLLSIKDEGIGISDEALKQIFEEYYRSREATRHHPTGSGLGLAIVWEIVRLHEGKISIRSKLKKGTTFTIKIKLRR